MQGGKLDLDSAARTVLHDWNIGKIRYFTHPPAVHPSAIPSAPSKGSAPSTSLADSSTSQVLDNTIGSSVVTNYSEAFDLAALLGEADAEAFGGLNTSDEARLGKSVPAPPARRYAEDETQIQADEEPEATTDITADLSHATTSTLGKRQRDAFDSDDDEEEEETEAAEELDSDEEADNLLGGKSTGAWEARAISRTLTAAANPTKKSALPVSQKSEPAYVPPLESQNEPEWLERQRAKASLPSKRNQVELNRKGKMTELSTIFSEEELKSLAPSRGTSRKKAKKQKRREERSGAGLVNILETAMDLKKAKGVDESAEPPQVKRKGLFDLLEQVEENPGSKELAVDEDEEL